MRRSLVLCAILGIGLTSVWVQAAQQSSSPERRATTAPAQTFNPANFTGTVTPHSTADIRMNRYHFDPGARTKWHSHEAGQVIYVEEGRLRVQERGKGARDLEQGATLHVAPGVEHWHGAVPNGKGITQVSLSFGMTNWKETVSDNDYK
jgi:quercetin dioxygenase-like cupin family protein